MLNRVIGSLTCIILAACTTTPPRGAVFMLLGTLGGGTGFQVDMGKAGKTILTNAHVCKLANQNNQMWAIDETGRAHMVTVLYVSPNTDVCALSAVDGLPGFQKASRIDQKGYVRALGHPQMGPLTEASGRIIGAGLSISNAGPVGPGNPCNTPKETIVEGQCLWHLEVMRTTVHIEPGSSGSPALDKDGRVVGIYCSISANGDSNFIPFNMESK